MKKTVSVITPVFNGEPFLKQTVDSVMSQKALQNVILEHILISDDLDDYSYYELEKPGYRCIVLSTGQKGAGPSFARNLGVSKSTGEYLTFLDADDIWLPNRVSTLLPMVDQYGAACDTISFIDMDNNPLYGSHTVIKKDGVLTHKDAISIDGAYFPIYKRNALTHQWDEDLGFSEDFLYNFLAICQTKTLYVHKRPLMAYRIRPGSISHTMPESGYKVDRAYRYLAESCPFIAFMSESNQDIFLNRVKAKMDLNLHYMDAWRENNHLTFEEFVGDPDCFHLAS